MALSTRRRGKTKPIEATRQGVPGHGHASAVRHGTPAGKAFLAEVGPDFGRGSFRGVFGPGAAATGRIEMPMR